VSAIASLAASMAMSTPLPVNTPEPRDGFAPIPSIAYGVSLASEASSAISNSLDSFNVRFKFKS
jgi:hypothetical protein